MGPLIDGDMAERSLDEVLQRLRTGRTIIGNDFVPDEHLSPVNLESRIRARTLAQSNIVATGTGTPVSNPDMWQQVINPGYDPGYNVWSDGPITELGPNRIANIDVIDITEVHIMDETKEYFDGDIVYLPQEKTLMVYNSNGNLWMEISIDTNEDKTPIGVTINDQAFTINKINDRGVRNLTDSEIHDSSELEDLV